MSNQKSEETAKTLEITRQEVVAQIQEKSQQIAEVEAQIRKMDQAIAEVLQGTTNAT